jgi:hypothetical protein
MVALPYPSPTGGRRTPSGTGSLIPCRVTPRSLMARRPAPVGTREVWEETPAAAVATRAWVREAPRVPPGHQAKMAARRGAVGVVETGVAAVEAAWEGTVETPAPWGLARMAVSGAGSRDMLEAVVGSRDMLEAVVAVT